MEGFPKKKYEKPPQVREAQKKGDREALARMGSAGGEASADRRALEKAVRQFEAERRTKEEADAAEEIGKIYRMNDEGDIVPPYEGSD